MNIKAKLLVVAVLIVGAVAYYKYKYDTHGNTGHIRILDIQLIDADTGQRPEEGGITLGPPEPFLDGPFIQEMQVERNSPDRYRVRVTWIQHNKVDQCIEVSVTGYDPYVATMEDIESCSSWRSIGGQINKKVKIHKKKNAQQAAPRNR